MVLCGRCGWILASTAARLDNLRAKSPASDDLSCSCPFPPSCLHAAGDLTVTRSQPPAPWWVVARRSGTRARTTFPSDMRASLPTRGGASAPGASSPQSAHRPPEPVPGDGVGGARSHLATANRPMQQHSQAPPAGGSSRGAQCSTEAAPRRRLQRRGRHCTGRGWEGAAGGRWARAVGPADRPCGAERLRRGR